LLNKEQESLVNTIGFPNTPWTPPALAAWSFNFFTSSESSIEEKSQAACASEEIDYSTRLKPVLSGSF
jgi:hypothetical protein